MPPKQASGASALPAGDDVLALLRALAKFTFSNRADERRFFSPNFLKLARMHPHQLVEGTVHLGMWRHYARYIPKLVNNLREGELRERQRAIIFPE